jgi:hypothetical protein
MHNVVRRRRNWRRWLGIPALNRYLRNETYPMRLTLADITSHLDREQILQPPSGRSP